MRIQVPGQFRIAPARAELMYRPAFNQTPPRDAFRSWSENEDKMLIKTFSSITTAIRQSLRKLARPFTGGDCLRRTARRALLFHRR